ncbi:MAG: hypothetical protein ACTSYA_13165 [Candidatus Kariarchaeaceae archaeon]
MVEITGTPTGDSFENAIPIVEGSYVGDSPLPGPFYDDIVFWNSSIFYVFWIEEGDQYQISLTGDIGTVFDLALFDGMSYLDEIDYSVKLEYPDYLEGIATSSQYLYILVVKYNEAEDGLYELTLNIETIIEGDSFENAIPIVEGNYTGTFPLPGPFYDIDLWNTTIYYVFWVEEGEEFRIYLTGDVGTDYDVFIFDGMSYANLIASSMSAFYPEWVTGVPLFSQYLYIMISAYLGLDDGGYELSLDLYTLAVSEYQLFNWVIIAFSSLILTTIMRRKKH